MGRPQESSVLVEGPWTHRDISANGARFHAAEIGQGPLVLLLHGFPEFWWSWRHQLGALANAGFRAVAPDLRGYGASDKPPRGYDVFTLAADVAGMVRALGERDAVVVGSDWGGLLAWVVATLHPGVVSRLVTVSMPHPLQLRRAALLDGRQRQASAYTLGFQLPWLPERRLVADQGAAVEGLLRGWAAPGWPDREAARRYRAAMLLPGVAHSSLEYYRWMFRSLPRPDGLRAARLLGRGVTAPTLQLHGALDRCVLAATAAGSNRYVRGPYDWCLLEGVGHYPHEEAPERVNPVLLRWAAGGVGGGAGEAGRRAGGPSVGRDRDARGRPRSARPRDPTGRPLPRDAGGDPVLPDPPALPPVEAVAEAERLIAAGQPFRAHEVLEAVWKAAPGAERELWRGLAQVAVGLTHVQRGNAAGGVALLRRGSALVDPDRGAPPYDLALDSVATQARSLAERLTAADTPTIGAADLRMALRQSPGGKS